MSLSRKNAVRKLDKLSPKIDLLNNKYELNINDFSYPEIEKKVEEFVLEPHTGNKTIVTGSSSHMIEMVENVVKKFNPYYDVLEEGLRIFKGYELLEVA
tara:strand:+ start:319 stop:615 length:297 start_codon:yes stop_codon:yes gene_type:complete